jgi:23S rRNA (adenine-C8)-methyltransferase
VAPNPPVGTRYATLQRVLAEAGAPSYRLTQLLRAIHERGITEVERLVEFPRALRDRLASEIGPALCELRPVARQSAEQVEKVLFESRTGARIESVLTHYRSGFTSLCISTQVGCGLGCTFCATGAVGLVRNLTADEICDQVLYFRARNLRESRTPGLDSIAFMGMGEALANPHTFPALHLLTSKDFFGISPRRITVSTVGFAPGLERLVEEFPQVTVTLSVHSPYDAERGELIPLQHRFPLANNLAILDEHVVRTRRKAYLAYLLIDGHNDSLDHAHALAALVTGLSRPELFCVNVIAYNSAVGVTPRFRPPRPSRVGRFLRVLREHGLHATRRQQFGGSLSAACGQLHARYLDGRQPQR